MERAVIAAAHDDRWQCADEFSIRKGKKKEKIQRRMERGAHIRYVVVATPYAGRDAKSIRSG
jgi:hypothetical protein